ncbi:MAG TPA: endolytic transglycosylase MltG [Gemmatimonadales bacterium]|nr:endolytic transglycosylase MltG [Gemmatimonadales bacterium]
MRRRALLALVPLLAACVSAPQHETVRVTIARGTPLRVVAESLAAHGIVAAPRWFRVYASLLGEARSIPAGTYDLPRDASVREVLDALVHGPAATNRLTIPEGLMLSEVAEQVQQQLEIPVDSFLAAARDSTLRAEVGTSAPTLEGYLYPSTYRVPAGADAHEVVEQMVDEFRTRWQPAWTARLDTLGMTRQQIVTLASIIEGEVKVPEDRELVSSVYHNRLSRGMRLQADPTVIYALGTRRRLYEKDYTLKSPYNTYLIDGLPPGPIGEPSVADIQAALYPAKTDYLYFVAGPNGKHIFSRTLREHLRAVNRVRRLAEEARAAR